METWARCLGWGFIILLLGSSPALAAKGLRLDLGLGVDDAFIHNENVLVSEALPKGLEKTSFVPAFPTYAAELNLGYGFTRSIYAGLYAGYATGYANFDRTWNLADYGILGKYSFGKSEKFAPYLDAGLCFPAFNSSQIIGEFTRAIRFGWKAGVGLDWFLGQKQRAVLSLDLSYHADSIVQERFITGDYHEKAQINLEGVFLLFKFGYVWRPQK